MSYLFNHFQKFAAYFHFFKCSANGTGDHDGIVLFNPARADAHVLGFANYHNAIYKKWDFGLGVSYQFAQFKEKYDDSVSYLDYNMVFATLSIGYNF